MSDAPSPPVDFNALILDLARRTEAGEALVTAANVEDWLEHMLLMNMRELSKTKQEDLFRGYGPLAWFSAKIAVAYALNLIDDDTRADLMVLKEIRNEFAHSKTSVHFTSPEMTRFPASSSAETAANQLLFGNKALACVEKMKASAKSRYLIRAIQNYRPSISQEKDHEQSPVHNPSRDET